MKKIFLVLLLITIIDMNFTLAQEYLENMHGKWDYHYYTEAKGGYRSELNYAMSRTELDKVKQKINDVVETMHQNPVLKNPIGFTATVQSSVWTNAFDIDYNVASLVNARIQSEIVIWFCPLLRKESGEVIKNCVEVEHSDIILNNPKRSTHKYLNFGIDGYDKRITAAAKKVNEIFIKPIMIKKLADGVIAYNNGIVVVANTSRPYWIPVTVGELFDLQINYWLLESQKSGDTSVLDMVKQEKSMLSNEELMQPAYHTSDNLSEITIEENISPYMRFNPDYFDDSLPRTNVQLITINAMNSAFEESDSHTNIDYIKFREFTKLLDGENLRRLLDLK